jgi:hypothetical protein
MTDVQQGKNTTIQEREGEQHDSERPASPEQAPSETQAREKVKRDAHIEDRFEATDN